VNNFSNVKQILFKVNIWIRLQLISELNLNLNQTFEIIQETLEFIEEYLNISRESFPTKLGKKKQINFYQIKKISILDFLGIPDLILDEKASVSWGLLTFREEFLSVDFSLNSAERLQTTTKILVEHILQIVIKKKNRFFFLE
jgi:hypothetical protein